MAADAGRDGEAEGDGDDAEFPVPALADRARECARALRGAERVLLASHVDADGLTSAAVASAGLARAGIDHDVVFYDQLDEAAVAEVAASGVGTAYFTDFGSGQLDVVTEYADDAGFTPVVADHHRPADASTPCHCNPLLEGIDGASELSGAGAAYLVARALAEQGAGPGEQGAGPGERSVDAPPTGPAVDPRNRDLAALAVVGAVGDMQSSDGELVGANRAVAAEGVAAGTLDSARDLALYGKQTRPLPKLLEYASDVHVPGVSNDRAGAMALLEEVDVDLRDGSGGGDGSGEGEDAGSGQWRRWVDLSFEERQAVASAVLRRAIEGGVSPDRVEELVGTTYTLPGEEPGTELRDADEFATLLNATARYERADVGLAVCLGDRADALDEARRLLRQHRRNLSSGLEYVKRNGVTRERHLQWFHAGEEIRATIVGIVAGMAVGSAGVDRGAPIVAFARKSEDEVKVSARGTPGLVRRGLDLSTVMSEAAGAVGGGGGGHDVAAGATVPPGEEEAFVERADEIVGEQLG